MRHHPVTSARAPHSNEEVEFGLWVAALRALLDEMSSAAAGTMAATAALSPSRLDRYDPNRANVNLSRASAHSMLMAETSEIS